MIPVNLPTQYATVIEESVPVHVSEPEPEETYHSSSTTSSHSVASSSNEESPGIAHSSTGPLSNTSSPRYNFFLWSWVFDHSKQTGASAKTHFFSGWDWAWIVGILAIIGIAIYTA